MLKPPLRPRMTATRPQSSTLAFIYGQPSSLLQCDVMQRDIFELRVYGYLFVRRWHRSRHCVARPGPKSGFDGVTHSKACTFQSASAVSAGPTPLLLLLLLLLILLPRPPVGTSAFTLTNGHGPRHFHFRSISTVPDFSVAVASVTMIRHFDMSSRRQTNC